MFYIHLYWRQHFTLFAWHPVTIKFKMYIQQRCYSVCHSVKVGSFCSSKVNLKLYRNIIRISDRNSVYCKACVKRPLSKKPKNGSHDHLSLNVGHKYCRMLQGQNSAKLSILIKLPFVIKSFVFIYFSVTVLHRFYCTLAILYVNYIILDNTIQTTLYKSAHLLPSVKKGLKITLLE